jgi:predicted helicase
MTAAQAALAMTAAQFGLRRCLAFVPRTAQARQFAGTLATTVGLLPAGRRPDGPVTARFVHGEMSSAQRELVLDRLRHPPEGGWSVVANARCLGEGVDVPAIDSVLFAAPKNQRHRHRASGRPGAAPPRRRADGHHHRARPAARPR